MSARFTADLEHAEVLDSLRPGWSAAFTEAEYAQNVAFQLNEGVVAPDAWFWSVKARLQRGEEKAS